MMNPTQSELINQEVTQKTAELAGLSFSDSEIELLTPQLFEVLKHIQKIQEVSLEGVDPLFYPVEFPLALREDQPIVFPSGSLLEAAPDLLSGGFRVPPILG